MKSFIVGLTGGIGSGKSYISSKFEGLGAHVIDLDAISKSLTGPGQPSLIEICQNFGPDLIDKGILNRPKLRDIVFKSEVARNKLNEILHPKIFVVVTEEISKSVAPYIIIDHPLLIAPGKPSQYLSIVNDILVVDCREETQIRRVVARSKLQIEQIKQIMSTQATREERLKYANNVIYNDEDTDVDVKVKKLDFYYRLFTKK